MQESRPRAITLAAPRCLMNGPFSLPPCAFLFQFFCPPPKKFSLAQKSECLPAVANPLLGRCVTVRGEPVRLGSYSELLPPCPRGGSGRVRARQLQQQRRGAGTPERVATATGMRRLNQPSTRKALKLTASSAMHDDECTMLQLDAHLSDHVGEGQA
jgi:hypothetical protein